MKNHNAKDVFKFMIGIWVFVVVIAGFIISIKINI